MRRAAESPFTKRIDKRVLVYVRKRGAIRVGETIVAGVSGGPDSTALLLILARLRDELGLRIVATHFDHRLRSRTEAEGDRAFVEKLARSLRMEFVAGRGDVAARARRAKESNEEAARNMRYGFLGREAKRAVATAVVVGHTLDDRAETVLMHIIRGAGLDGLAAMPPRAPWPFGRGPEIARPLLELSRRDTERYCRESKVEPRRDPTNDLLIATRNRVRHELMPVLRSFNPRITEALARLADAAAEDASLLSDQADGLWRLLAAKEQHGVSLGSQELDELPRAIGMRLLRLAVGEVSGGGAEVTTEQLERLLETGGPGAKVTLPGGLIGIRRGERIGVYSHAPKPAAPIACRKLRSPGKNRVGDWTIEVGGEETKDDIAIDAGAISGQLTVRSRQNGDRMRPLGLGG